MSEDKKNKNIVKSIFENYINKGNIEELSELISSEYIDLGTGKKGVEAYMQNIESLILGFPDIQFEIKDLVAEKNRVVIRWQWQGTHKGNFRSIMPTGKKAVTDGMAIYTLENGKVVSSIAVVDKLGPLQAIGAVPTEFLKTQSN